MSEVRKGLEFPLVALPGVRHMPAAGEDEKETTRVFYAAATRATQSLILRVSGQAGLGQSGTEPCKHNYLNVSPSVKGSRVAYGFT